MSYRSLWKRGEARFTIKKSEFIGIATPVTSLEETEQFLQQVREDHPMATHRCSAYILGVDASHQEYDDDGEPRGTAGIPMLEVLKRETLCNVAVVVVRYFGGIKLGAAGLVRAYTQACSAAIKEAIPAEYAPFQKVVVRYAYPEQGKCDYAMAPFWELDRQYAEDVRICYCLPEAKIDKIHTTLLNLTRGKLEWKTGESHFCPVDALGEPLERK